MRETLYGDNNRNEKKKKSKGAEVLSLCFYDAAKSRKGWGGEGEVYMDTTTSAPFGKNQTPRPSPRVERFCMYLSFSCAGGGKKSRSWKKDAKGI